MQKLKNDGKHLYVLTASPHLVTDVCLQANGVFDLFDGVYSVDDFSYTKSECEIYHELAEREGLLLSDTIFYDDNRIALETGKRAGLTVYGILDRQSESELCLIRALVHRFVSSYRELL